jgi:hypothetical protein
VDRILEYLRVKAESKSNAQNVMRSLRVDHKKWE